MPTVSSSAPPGTASGPAWSLRSAGRLARAPGTSAYRAKQTASSRLVLPAPVGPWMRNSPSAASASTSTTTVPANGPNAVDLEPVQPHAAPADRAHGRRPARRHAPRRRRPAARPATASTASASSARSSSLAPRPAAHVGQEVAAHVDVGGRGDAARRTSASGPRRPAGRTRSSRVCGKRRRSLLHGPERAYGVGERDLAPRGLGARWRGVGEQLVEGAAQHGERAVDRRRRRARRHEPVAGRGRPAGCPWCAAHSENDIAHGGAAVADPGRRPPARPWRWPERDVVGAGEDLGRHRGDAADRDVALGVAGDPAGDEGVGHDDRAARRAARRRPRTRSMAARSTPAWVRSVGAEGVGGQGAARGRGAGSTATSPSSTGEPDVGDGRPQVQPGPLQEARPRTRAGWPSRGCRCDSTTWAPASTRRTTASREQLDGVGGGHRAVVDVAAHEHGVDPLGAHDLDEVVEVGGLGAEQPHLVERASQVPVGGVDQPHGSHATSGVRHPS